MKDIVTVANLTAAVFVLIIAISTLIRSYRKSKTIHLFICTAFTLFFFTVIDSVSYMIDGHASDVVLKLFNSISFLGVDCIFTLFGFYVWSQMNREQKTSMWIPGVVAILCGIDAIICIVGSTTGHLFTIENGSFKAGSWNNWIGIPNAIGMIFLVVAIIAKRKVLGRDAVIVYLLHLILPFVVLVVELFTDSDSMSYVSMCVAFMTVYIALIADELVGERKKKEMYQELYKVDILTGLQNRRGLLEIKDEITKTQKLGILYCDLNRLKFTNDTLGHEEGDKLIVKFSEMLKQFFDESRLFRVSGDEFVATFVANNKNKEQVSKFKEFVRQNASIASVGYAEGSGKNFDDIFTKAEDKMYKDKAKFYASYDISRRQV